MKTLLFLLALIPAIARAQDAPPDALGPFSVMWAAVAVLVVNVAVLFARSFFPGTLNPPGGSTPRSRGLTRAIGLLVGLGCGAVGLVEVVPVDPDFPGALWVGRLTSGLIAAGIAIFGRDLVIRGVWRKLKGKKRDDSGSAKAGLVIALALLCLALLPLAASADPIRGDNGGTSTAVNVDGTGDLQVDIKSGTISLPADAATETTQATLLTTTAHDAAFGTAGSADAQVRSVQGVASMTPLDVDVTKAPAAATIQAEQAGISSDTTLLAATTDARLTWFTARESAGTAAVATVILRHDTVATTCDGPVIAYIELSANGSVGESTGGDRGLAVASGVCADVIAGTVDVSIATVVEVAP